VWIDIEDAIKIYARFCRARFGAAAGKLVRDKALQLAAAGDLEGQRVWNEVARELDNHDGASERCMG
jgi:hypothetical protein